MEEILRQHVIESGISARELAERTGVSQPLLSRFIRGGGMTMRSAQCLVDYFGLELTRKRRRR